MWYCHQCVQTILAYNDIDDDYDVFMATTREGIINDAYRQLDSNTLFMPFEINDESFLWEMDPDFPYI